MTDADAKRCRNAFFTAYPGLAAWHRKVSRENAAETRTLTGRRRLMTPQKREGDKWTGTPHTERLNTPIQGAGADGLKLALRSCGSVGLIVCKPFPCLWSTMRS